MRLIAIIAIMLLPLTASSQVADFPEFRFPVSTIVKIKDLRNPLSLDLTVATRMTVLDDRATLSFRFGEPNLYKKLLDALKSRASSGCSIIWRGPASLEVKLCRVHWFEIVWARSTSSLWLRGNAKLRLQHKIGRDTYNQGFSLEASARTIGDSIELRGRSVDLNNIPGEIDKLIAKEIHADLPLPTCLHNRELRIEGISMPRGANEIEISASVLATQIPYIMVECLANK